MVIVHLESYQYVVIYTTFDRENIINGLIVKSLNFNRSIRYFIAHRAIIALYFMSIFLPEVIQSVDIKKEFETLRTYALVVILLQSKHIVFLLVVKV